MKIRKGYKKTEIGRIPKEWEVVKLEEIISSLYNGIWGETPIKQEKSYPVIRSTEITHDGKIDLSNVAFRRIPDEKVDRYSLKEGDILLVASSGSSRLIGRAAIFKQSREGEVYLFSNFMLRVRPKNVDSIFLYYYLNSSQYYRFLKSLQQTSTGLRNLPKREVVKFKLPLPPLPEQRKIAEILSTVDETIEKVDEAIAKTERLKKGLMQNLLTKGIGHKEFKDTEIGRIPKEWEVVRLVEIVDIFDKKRIPLSEIERSKMKGKFPYCGANGIIDYINDFIFDGKFLLLAEDGGNFKAFGQKAYLMFGKFWANNHVHVLKALSSLCSEEFLLYMLNFMDLKSWVVGSTRKKLNQGDMKKIPIPLPPLPEQKKIAEILSTVDKRLELLKNKKEKLKRIKKGLMNDLLTGKMRVKV